MPLQISTGALYPPADPIRAPADLKGAHSICDDFVHVSAQDAECARCVRRIESDADLNLVSKKNIAAVCNLLARALNCI